MAYGRFGRSATAMATIGVFGLLLGGWLADHHDRGVPPFNRPSREDLLNAAGVLATTLAIFVLGFYLNPEIPSTFMLTLTVVWAAIRFNVVVAAAQCLLTGAGTVLMTILGYGPIANVGNSESPGAARRGVRGGADGDRDGHRGDAATALRHHRAHRATPRRSSACGPTSSTW